MTEIAKAILEHFAQEKREAEAEREKYYASLPEEDRNIQEALKLAVAKKKGLRG